MAAAYLLSRGLPILDDPSYRPLLLQRHIQPVRCEIGIIKERFGFGLQDDRAACRDVHRAHALARIQAEDVKGPPKECPQFVHTPKGLRLKQIKHGKALDFGAAP
jgi:hypothetical protein